MLYTHHTALVHLKSSSAVHHRMTNKAPPRCWSTLIDRKQDPFSWRISVVKSWLAGRRTKKKRHLLMLPVLNQPQKAIWGVPQCDIAFLLISMRSLYLGEVVSCVVGHHRISHTLQSCRAAVMSSVSLRCIVKVQSADIIDEPMRRL